MSSHTRSFMAALDLSCRLPVCAPLSMRRALGVVGLAEVITHLPRIYGEYRKLVSYARNNRPDAALLTDNPDFNLRLAADLKRLGVPVFYLVAPQVWAWRQGRVKTIRSLVDKLFCLFPFEEEWFRERGVEATYIGHPLAFTVRRTCTRDEFLRSSPTSLRPPHACPAPGQPDRRSVGGTFPLVLESCPAN